MIKITEEYKLKIYKDKNNTHYVNPKEIKDDMVLIDDKVFPSKLELRKYLNRYA